ncbi:OXSR1 [Symbiodinium sp. CCMP2592]|nr:OXSR1 [Symbiodinium sp. CCMP2592]
MWDVGFSILQLGANLPLVAGALGELVNALAKPRDVSDFLAMENPILKPCALQLHGKAEAPLVQSLATQTVIAAMRIQHFVRSCLTKLGQNRSLRADRAARKIQRCVRLHQSMPRVPLTWQGFEFGQLLGSGASATVHAAITPDGWPVAVKRLRPHPMDMDQEELKHELRMLLHCEHANYIIQAYYVIDNIWTGLVLEKLRDSLFHFAAEQCISVVDFLAAAGQLAQALHWLQGCAVVHGDVKAANVFLQSLSCDWPRSLKLGDFESAQFAGAGLLTKKVGTVFYWSPEMLEGRGYSFGHDVWSLGKLLGDLRCEDFRAEALARNILVHNAEERPSALDVAFQVHRVQSAM